MYFYSYNRPIGKKILSPMDEKNFGTFAELRVPAAAQRAENSVGGMAEWSNADDLKATQGPRQTTFPRRER